MDAICQLDQLARAVKRMRELQTTDPAGHTSSMHFLRQMAEGRVDELVARVLGDICAPIPPDMVAALLDDHFYLDLPELPVPDSKPDFELPQLPELPPLPPPPIGGTP